MSEFRGDKILSGKNFEGTVSSGNGDAVVIPFLGTEGGAVSCTLITSGNTGKFQATTSPLSRVTAGTANWVDWDVGDVTATTMQVLRGPATAVRAVSVAGAVAYEVAY